MKTIKPETTREESNSPFVKVAECLYRHKSSETYYGLVKRGRKQFRKSFKTTDRKLAERRLADFRQKVGRITQVKGASKISFAELADRWFDTVKGNVKDEIEDGAASDAFRIAGALLEGTWECSLVVGDVSATMSKFTDNLVRLMSCWPALAGMCQQTLTGIVQQMPLQYQQSYWRASMTARAWL